MTLYDKLTDWRRHQCRKHELHRDEDEYIEHQIDSLSQHEFLRELSDAFEEILNEREKSS